MYLYPPLLFKFANPIAPLTSKPGSAPDDNDDHGDTSTAPSMRSMKQSSEAWMQFGKLFFVVSYHEYVKCIEMLW